MDIAPYCKYTGCRVIRRRYCTYNHARNLTRHNSRHLFERARNCTCMYVQTACDVRNKKVLPVPLSWAVIIHNTHFSYIHSVSKRKLKSPTTPPEPTAGCRYGKYLAGFHLAPAPGVSEIPRISPAAYRSS